MAAYLELSPQQKESLFRVLEAWTRRLEDEVAAATMDDTTGEDPGEAFALERAVDRRGQTEVLAVLSPSQRDLFEGLSPEARSLEGMALVALSSVTTVGRVAANRPSP